jgi:hypothetical protein
MILIETSFNVWIKSTMILPRLPKVDRTIPNNKEKNVTPSVFKLRTLPGIA